MAKETILGILRNNINVDLVSKNKAGNFIFRRGYYYRMGCDSDNLAAALLTQISNLGLTAKLIEHGDQFTSFKPGVSVARNSHFYATFAITAGE